MAWVDKLIRRKQAARPASTSLLAPWSGETVNLDAYWAEAWSDLRARQAELASRLKLASAHWTVDQDQGLIRFDRADGVVVTAPVQIIGAWNPKSELFTWGWDHPSVKVRLRADAERTRWFGERHELEDFTERSVKVTEGEAWRLTSVAMRVNAAAGAYRGPTEGPVVFMTLGELKVRE